MTHYCILQPSHYLKYIPILKITVELYQPNTHFIKLYIKVYVSYRYNSLNDDMLFAFRQIIAIIKLLNVVYNLQYTDFQINIATSYYKLRNYLYFADLNLVTGDDIQVRAHKIELSPPASEGRGVLAGCVLCFHTVLCLFVSEDLCMSQNFLLILLNCLFLLLLLNYFFLLYLFYC